jgi:hypothetical protein
LVGPSGIGTSVIRSADRESGDAGVFAQFEVDHLLIQDITSVPDTLIDMTNTRSSSVHNIYFYTNAPTDNSNKIGIVCADLSPGNLEASCFFNNFFALHGLYGTFLHQSARFGNSSVNTFTAIDGYTRIGIDTTGSYNNSLNSVYSDWYFNGEADPNSWSIYGQPPANSVLSVLAFETMTNYNPGIASGIFDIPPAQSQVPIGLPLIQSSQGIALPTTTVAGLPSCSANPLFFDALRVVTDANAPTYNGALTGGGSVTVPVFCNGTAWVAH